MSAGFGEEERTMAERRQHLSYLDLERQTDVRHEYLDGVAWAMAGGPSGTAASRRT